MKNILSNINRSDRIYLTLNILVFFLVPIISPNPFSFLIDVMILNCIVCLISGVFMEFKKEYIMIPTLMVIILCLIISHYSTSSIIYSITVMIISLAQLKTKRSFYIFIYIIISLMFIFLGEGMVASVFIIFAISLVSLFIGNFIKRMLGNSKYFLCIEERFD